VFTTNSYKNTKEENMGKERRERERDKNKHLKCGITINVI
jgi:hypothetical protein